MRNPTLEELRNLKNLSAEAQYLGTVAQAQLAKIQKIHDAAASSGFSPSTGVFVAGNTPLLDDEGQQVKMSLAEAKSIADANLAKHTAEQAAVLAVFELRKACGVEMGMQWNEANKKWEYPDEATPAVSLPDGSTPAEASDAGAACPCSKEATVTPIRRGKKRK